MKNKPMRLTVILLASAALGGCVAGPEPEEVVEDYLTAVLQNDEVQTAELSCTDWELQARAEGRSFEGVEASLEELGCSTVGQEGETALVKCSGRIVYSYGGGENSQVDLAGRSFVVIWEDDVWRMCGYE